MNDEQTELLVNAILMIEQRLCTISDVMIELLDIAKNEKEMEHRTIAVSKELLHRFIEAKKEQTEIFGFDLTNKQFFTLILDTWSRTNEENKIE